MGALHAPWLLQISPFGERGQYWSLGGEEGEVGVVVGSSRLFVLVAVFLWWGVVDEGASSVVVITAAGVEDGG